MRKHQTHRELDRAANPGRRRRRFRSRACLRAAGPAGLFQGFYAAEDWSCRSPRLSPVAKPAAPKPAFSFPRPASKPAPRPAPKPAFSFPRPTPQPAPVVVAGRSRRGFSGTSFSFGGGPPKIATPAPRPSPASVLVWLNSETESGPATKPAAPAFSFGPRPAPRPTRGRLLSPRRRRSHLRTAPCCQTDSSTGAEAGVLVWWATPAPRPTPPPPAPKPSVAASISLGTSRHQNRRRRRRRRSRQAVGFNLFGSGSKSPACPSAGAGTCAENGGWILIVRRQQARAGSCAGSREEGRRPSGTLRWRLVAERSAPSPSPSSAPAAKPPPATTGGVPTPGQGGSRRGARDNAAKQKVAADARKRQAEELPLALWVVVNNQQHHMLTIARSSLSAFGYRLTPRRPVVGRSMMPCSALSAHRRDAACIAEHKWVPQLNF